MRPYGKLWLWSSSLAPSVYSSAWHSQCGGYSNPDVMLIHDRHVTVSVQRVLASLSLVFCGCQMVTLWIATLLPHDCTTINHPSERRHRRRTTTCSIRVVDHTPHSHFLNVNSQKYNGDRSELSDCCLQTANGCRCLRPRSHRRVREVSLLAYQARRKQVVDSTDDGELAQG